jgi:hypothetical protein
VHREIEDLQVKLKEILYDCVTDVRATKAALYLLDHPANRYELITEYGFKGSVRTTADTRDPIVDRCARGPAPFFVNGLREEPRYSELLYQSKSDRLLVAPIYLRKQLVGFVDMRDKAGQASFDASDSPKAQRVAEKIVALFIDKNPFGQRFITVSGNEPLPSVLTGVYSAAAQPQPTPQPFPKPAALNALGETQINTVRDILRSLLFIPGAMVAVLAAPGVQEIAARAPLTDEAVKLLQSKISGWLAKHGQTELVLSNHVETLLAATVSPIRETDIVKVFTAPINAGSLRGIYLSVGFSGEPERAAHELLTAFHKYLELAIRK